jgi:hypothetical protein
MERGTITLKLANGKTLESSNGEELFWFHNSEGRSMIAPPPVIDKRVDGKQVGNVKK